MTAKALLTTLLPLVADLSRELPEGERYRRLLQAMRALLPCDAELHRRQSRLPLRIRPLHRRLAHIDHDIRGQAARRPFPGRARECSFRGVGAVR